MGILSCSDHRFYETKPNERQLVIVPMHLNDNESGPALFTKLVSKLQVEPLNSSLHLMAELINFKTNIQRTLLLNQGKDFTDNSVVSKELSYPIQITPEYIRDDIYVTMKQAQLPKLIKSSHASLWILASVYTKEDGKYKIVKVNLNILNFQLYSTKYL